MLQIKEDLRRLKIADAKNSAEHIKIFAELESSQAEIIALKKMIGTLSAEIKILSTMIEGLANIEEAEEEEELTEEEERQQEEREEEILEQIEDQTENFFLSYLGYRDWETDRKSTRLNSSH